MNENVSMKKTDIILSPGRFDISERTSTIAKVEWKDLEGRSVQGTLPEGAKLFVDEEEVDYTHSDEGFHSDLLFEYPKVGKYEVTLRNVDEEGTVIGPTSLWIEKDSVPPTLPDQERADLYSTQIVTLTPEVDLADEAKGIVSLKWFTNDGKAIYGELPRDAYLEVDGERHPFTHFNGDTFSNLIFDLEKEGNLQVSVAGLDGDNFTLGPVEIKATKASKRYIDIENIEFTTSTPIATIDKYGIAYVEFKFKVKYDDGEPYDGMPDEFDIKVDGVSYVPVFDIIEEGFFSATVTVSEVGTETYELYYNDVGTDKTLEIKVENYKPDFSLEETVVELDPSTIDLKDTNKTKVILKWYDEEGNSTEHDFSEDVTIAFWKDPSLLGQSELEYTPIEYTEKTSEDRTETYLEFEVNEIGAHEVRVTGPVTDKVYPFTLYVEDSRYHLDPSKTRFNITPGMMVSGEGQFIITIEPKDQDGNPYKVDPGSISFTKNDGEFLLVDFISYEDNVVKFSFFEEEEGRYSIEARIDDEDLSERVEISVLPKLEPGYDPDKTQWEILNRNVNISRDEKVVITFSAYFDNDEPLKVDKEDFQVKVNGVVAEGDIEVTETKTTFTITPTEKGEMSLELSIGGQKVFTDEIVKIVEDDVKPVEPEGPGEFDIQRSDWFLETKSIKHGIENKIEIVVLSFDKDGKETTQPDGLYYQIEGGALTELTSEDKLHETTYHIDVSDLKDKGEYTVSLFVLGEKFGEDQSFTLEVDEPEEPEPTDPEPTDPEKPVDPVEPTDPEEPGDEFCCACYECDNPNREGKALPIEELLEARVDHVLSCRECYPDEMTLD